MLLNLVLLARTAKTFEDALARALPEDSEARENFRMRIENTLFVQLLVGGRLEREGVNAKLLSLMALITLALAPVALLLMFEVKFLPYHSEAITWLHRGLLALDLALVWTLWPGYRSGWGVRLWPKAAWWLVVPGIGSAAALAFAVMVATFPDERIYLATLWLHGPNYLITPVNTLDLRGEDLIDDAKLAHILEKNESTTGAQRWVASLPLGGRDLTGADLSEADVRHVDFSGAILNRANLISSWAKKAHFDNAQLQGAVLVLAQLQGAVLVLAQLQGASLDNTQLQDASLDGAQLQGALLDNTQLQGARLAHTQLQGASLATAWLQGALLDYAQLQGALLDYAQLQGALLDYAQLQGASLNGAQLQGASFVDACVWRADARQAAWKDTRVELSKANKIHECDWTAASFAELNKLIAEKVPPKGKYEPVQGLDVVGEEVPLNNMHAAMVRIEQRLDPTKALEGENEMAKIWAARERETPAPEVYAKSLAGQWRELGCAAEGAPYVLPGLIRQLSDFHRPRLPDQSDAEKALVAAFLDEAHCAGAHGLSEADKAELKKIAAPAAPQAPKP